MPAPRRSDCGQARCRAAQRGPARVAIAGAKRAAGCAAQCGLGRGGLYELNHALALALEDGAEAAWLRGEDPLAAARLAEMPVGEMAAVYDQLLAERPERS
jgi:hypothetical protein